MKKNPLLALLLAIPFLTGCNSVFQETYKDADKYLVGSQTYNTVAITKIDADWKFGTLTLIEDVSATSTIVVEENDLPDSEKVHSYLDGDTLKIKFFASGHHGSNIKKEKKVLTLTYNPIALLELDVKITSGIFKAGALNPTNKFNFEMTSGNVELGRVCSTNVKAEQTSGTLKVNEMICDKANLYLTSGKLTIGKFDVDEVKAEMTSGTMDLGFHTLKTGEMEATSGTIIARLPEDGGKVRVKKTSGTVNVYDREYHIIDGVYTIGNGAAELSIELTSGRVEIR